MTKLFASDFDGTLHFWDTDDQYLVSPTDTAAIRAFQEAGGLFGVCTGRPLLGLTKQLDAEPGIDFTFDFYIATTGAAIWDRDRQLIWNKTIDRDLAEELYRTYGHLSKGDNPPFCCAGEDYWTLEQRDVPWPFLAYASSFDELPRPFYGYAMETETIEIAQEAAAEINERYAGVLHAYVNLASIDVVPVGCSKGSGLLKAAEHFGATLTGGIGDSYNDLELLDAADVAYTFASSPAEMHPHADILVNSAAEALGDFMRR